MSLPTLTSIPDCANVTLAVQPFIPQFLALPEKILESYRDIDALKHIYVTTNPLATAVAFSLLLVPFFFILSEITRNFSQVDRLWSVIPSIYNAHYVVWSRLNGVPTERTSTVLVFSVMWSLRLTYNYWRKGGYQIGSEDYRWKILRSKVNGFVFFLFNIFFICLTQSLLLLMITTPTYLFVVLNKLPASPKFDLYELAFSRTMMFFIIIEFFADQQQWIFHQAKHFYQQTARVPKEYKDTFTSDDLNRGFVITGLWSWCRHPNFAAEQAIWFTLYAWSCYATQTYYNWTGIGALGYILLFQASTNLTESISASKYAEYKEYQARVGKFIPRLGVEPRYKVSETEPTKKEDGEAKKKK